MNSPKSSDEDFKKLYPIHSNDWLKKHFGYTNIQSVKNRAKLLGIKKGKKMQGSDIIRTDNKKDKEVVVEKKTGVETRFDDKVVINWTTRTIITELGEFGSYTCNFSTHGAIQRYYVNAFEGKGHTQAETAMKFKFPHAKAVAIYAKLWGFTKASPGQTDIEFEDGLTVEEAVEENIQALKRKTVRKTEIKKWQVIQKNSDKWDNFRNSVYNPMKDWVYENLPKYKPPKYRPLVQHSSFCGVVGIADWHYLKFAYDHLGKPTYNRKKARKVLKDANSSLITQMMTHGRPEMLYLPVGNDNYHVDNIFHTTTAGTPQSGQTEGNWRLDMEVYVDIVIGMIDLYAQIAPVTVVPMIGNHDAHTSIMLHVFLKKFYENVKNVTVIDNQSARVYQQYGKNAFMFTHGDSMTQPKLKREAHRLFMAEAQKQKVRMNMIQHFAMFSGHIHTDAFEDLGVVKHFIIPSLAPADSWHQDKGYVGNKEEASLYLFDRKTGRKAIFYS